MSNRSPVVYGHDYMPPRPSTLQRVVGGTRWMMLVGGVVSLGVGVILILGPLLGVWHRGNTDSGALQAWNGGGSNSLAGAPPNDGRRTLTCGSGASGDYALVTFQDPGAYHYAGVAGDGTWDLLHERSMVHYATTPAPGQQGNVIIAFHREPNYEHIDQLDVGGTVTIEDRSCHTYTYRVTHRWVLDPSKVTQLVPTPGHELTLITCTPFWQDTQRIVWRADLVN